eukprot:GHVN01034139.1.p1 GENE.GHVN01034139.1~~GHVN01034139.1.p1  ORF type:complete len:146 (+),score=10.39 GHVN01034139.1:193-630(+)
MILDFVCLAVTVGSLAHGELEQPFKIPEAAHLTHGTYDPSCVYDRVSSRLILPELHHGPRGVAESLAILYFKRALAATGMMSEAVEQYLKYANPPPHIVELLKIDIREQCQLNDHAVVVGDPHTGQLFQSFLQLVSVVRSDSTNL